MLQNNIEYRDYTIKIEYSENIESPRNWVESSQFYTKERKRYSPDKIDEIYKDNTLGDMLLNILCKLNIPNLDQVREKYELKNRYRNTGIIKTHYENIIREYAVLLPVYKYEHGNTVYRTKPYSEGYWDSGLVGYIFESKNSIKKEYNVTKVSKRLNQHIQERLSKEVDIYSQWVNGEVYVGYIYLDNELVDVTEISYLKEDIIKRGKEFIDEELD